MASRAPNFCAGPFGALYDFYIERPRLTQAIGRLVWGVDSSVLYESMEPIRRVAPGATVIDVPCGEASPSVPSVPTRTFATLPPTSAPRCWPAPNAGRASAA